jgi:hypothetical protein
MPGMTVKNISKCQAPVANAYKPSYSGESWFQASLGKYFAILYLKHTQHKKGLVK